MAKTKVERVLCVPSSFLAEESPGEGRRRFLPVSGLPVGFGRTLAAVSEARERTEDLESDTSWRQLVCYAAVRRQGRTLVYRRAKGSGEGRLLGRASLGVGGHLEASDRPKAKNADAEFTYARGFLREADEEIGLRGAHLLRHAVVGYILDDASPVGLAHVGVVILADAAPRFDPRPSPGVEVCGWLGPDSTAPPEGSRWESWSELLIEQDILGRDLVAEAIRAASGA